MAKNILKKRICTLEDQIRENFPDLKVGDLVITSDRDRSYNCIAWAMGDSSQFWWPGADGYWPSGVPQAVTIQAFTAAFATVGFTPCADAKHVAGREKVALYTNAGTPTHAAFLAADGMWASKLGRDHDVKHRHLASIGDNRSAGYGAATHFFERSMPASSRPKMPNTQYEDAQKYDMTNEMQGRLKSKDIKGGIRRATGHKH